MAGRPEPALPEDRLKEILLTKVYNNDRTVLDADIAEKRSQGAGNDLSAVKKLIRDKGKKRVGEGVETTGYFLQLHHRKERQEGVERGFSAYLAVPAGGINTVHFENSSDIPNPKNQGLAMSFGEIQTWSGLERWESVISQQQWLEAHKGASIKVGDTKAVGRSLWQLADPITRIAPKQGLWNGWISGVFALNEFDEDGNKGEPIPILGDGGVASLAVGVTDKYDQKTGRADRSVASVKIKTANQLETLLGETYDPMLLMSDRALPELRDILNGQPVLIFGSGKTPDQKSEFGKRMKRPTVSLAGGVGLMVPYTPD